MDFEFNPVRVSVVNFYGIHDIFIHSLLYFIIRMEEYGRKECLPELVGGLTCKLLLW